MLMRLCFFRSSWLPHIEVRSFIRPPPQPALTLPLPLADHNREDRGGADFRSSEAREERLNGACLRLFSPPPRGSPNATVTLSLDSPECRTDMRHRPSFFPWPIREPGDSRSGMRRDKCTFGGGPSLGYAMSLSAASRRQHQLLFRR